MKSITGVVSKTAIAAGLFLCGHLATAHHSTTGMMEDDATEISGTIKEFQFTNPHSWIQVLVTNDAGEVVEWSVEWGIPNSLMRQGYGPSTFPEGAEVTMRLHRTKSGAPMGEFIAARLGDGKTVGNWQSTD